jgi:hypothetical protein
MLNAFENNLKKNNLLKMKSTQVISKQTKTEKNKKELKNFKNEILHKLKLNNKCFVKRVVKVNQKRLHDGLPHINFGL